MQATAYTYDSATRCGSVLLDDGTPVQFGAAAFDAGGLRLLRPGQRVRIEIAEEDADALGAGQEAAGRAASEAKARGGRGEEGDREGAGLRITLVTLQTF